MCFCNTKGSTERLTKFLQMRGLDAQCIHGDIPQRKREAVMALFREGKLHVFVATDVAARGIDVDDVDAVFNYDVPDETSITSTASAARVVPSVTAWPIPYCRISPAVCGWTTSPAIPAARSSPPRWMNGAAWCRRRSDMKAHKIRS